MTALVGGVVRESYFKHPGIYLSNYLTLQRFNVIRRIAVSNFDSIHLPKLPYCTLPMTIAFVHLQILSFLAFSIHAVSIAIENLKCKNNKTAMIEITIGFLLYHTTVSSTFTNVQGALCCQNRPSVTWWTWVFYTHQPASNVLAFLPQVSTHLSFATRPSKCHFPCAWPRI